ncbi:unnamed protein product [Taenia asiatica]|uniref:Deltameth_res domain-containing protein n=1 Tax=Taenia asiatica TaxID=60517 RepID=A0A0R3WAD4_TAEAS|nr:unnamed protein product [Taenia asiatica]
MAALLLKNVVRLFPKVAHPEMVSVAKSHIQPIRFPKVTYNDMTKPEGPWREKYDALNAEYSRYMYLGICSLVVSLGIVSVSIFPRKRLNSDLVHARPIQIHGTGAQKHARGSGVSEPETRDSSRYSGMIQRCGEPCNSSRPPLLPFPWY